MKSFSIFASLCVAALLASCSEKNEFIGQWEASAPANIVEYVPGAATALSQMQIDFANGADQKSGPVQFTSTMNITQPVSGDTSFVEPYEVSIAATSSVSGTWSRLKDDDDDLALSFDMSTLNVKVDPHGVTFSQNLLTGAQQPVVDSLTAATAQRWKGIIENAVAAQLSTFATIEDVDTHSDKNVLTFEVKVPGQKDDMKYAFRRLLGSE